jgi:anti-sigma-K factor RskA
MLNDAHELDSLPAYALGSLEAEETRRIEAHLLNCLICRNELADFQAVVEQLSLAAPAAIPSPDLKEQLLQRVRTTRPEQRVSSPVPKRPWLERLLPVWGLASLCLIAVLAGTNVLFWQRLNQLEVNMSAGGMRAVPLSASITGSAATGFVLISADGEDGALVVDGLPQLDEDRQYQLWLIHNGERISGAIFSTDEKDYGGTRIRAPRSLLDYSAVDVTIEPKGGSPQPTGEHVLGGPLHQP